MIVGLGNPESRYNGTRHNVGASVVARFVNTQGGTFRRSAKFRAQMCELSIGTEKVLAALPTTYYNASGESVQAIADFYKLAPADVLVVHDELMLPVGTLRTRLGGSSAGNNGIKSLTQHLGEDTARLRIGVHNDQRDYMDAADFVLSKFNAEERMALEQLQHVAEGCIEDFIFGQFTATTHASTID